MLEGVFEAERRASSKHGGGAGRSGEWRRSPSQWGEGAEEPVAGGAEGVIRLTGAERRRHHSEAEEPVGAGRAGEARGNGGGWACGRRFIPSPPPELARLPFPRRRRRQSSAREQPTWRVFLPACRVVYFLARVRKNLVIGH